MYQQGETGSVWSKNLILAMLSSLCVGIAGQLLNPTLPVYVVEIGIPETLAGTMLTAFALGALLFRPISGMLVDRIGRKKMVMIGAVVILCSYVCYLLTSTYYAMMAIRVLQGIGFCLTSTGLGTIASDVIPRDKITEGIGYYALAGAVSMTVGPAIGFFLKDSMGMTSIFITGLVLSVVCMFAAFNITYQEKLIKVEKGEKLEIKLYEKNSLLPAAMIFTVTVAQTALTTYLALYARSIGIGSVGSFFLLNSFGTISARVFAGRITNRIGEQKFLIAAVTLTACCMLAVGMVRSYSMLCLIAVVYGFGYGVLYPVTNAMSIKNARPENRGAANATYSASFDFGSILGGMIWGFVAAVTGYSIMYTIAAVLMLAVIPLTYVYRRKFPNS